MNDTLMFWLFYSGVFIFGALVGGSLAGLRCQRLLNKQREHFVKSTKESGCGKPVNFGCGSLMYYCGDAKFRLCEECRSSTFPARPKEKSEPKDI